MRFGRLLLPLLVPLGMAALVSTALAQDMPPLPGPEPVTPERAAPQASDPPNPAATATPSPQVQAQPPAAGTPETPSAVTPVIPPATVSPPAAQAPANPVLTRGELDQLLAPIALYPDQLLSQILMASTYPLEIVEASRWVNRPGNRSLKGEALIRALRDKPWDTSVKALTPFPQVLQILCERLEWTDRLGSVFLAQQAEVMDAVQRLRKEAMAAGNFNSGPQCRCVVETRDGIVIVAPARPSIVYVPVYDPYLVYGPWPYPLYPPIVFPVPVGFAFAPGFFIGFGGGVNVAYYGPLWGWSSINWSGRSIIVDPTGVGIVAGAVLAGRIWVHDPARRAGIASGPVAMAARFGGTGVAATTVTSRATAFAARRGAASAVVASGREPSQRFAAGRDGPGVGRAAFAGHRGPGFGPGPRSVRAGRGGGPPRMAMGGGPGRGGDRGRGGGHGGHH